MKWSKQKQNFCLTISCKFLIFIKILNITSWYLVVVFFFPYMWFVKDINECRIDPKPCEFTCSNSVGSFICGCPTGYVLNADGLTCRGRCYLFAPSHPPPFPPPKRNPCPLSLPTKKKKNNPHSYPNKSQPTNYCFGFQKYNQFSNTVKNDTLIYLDINIIVSFLYLLPKK